MARNYKKSIATGDRHHRWITVYRPEEATRFWTREAAEAAIFPVAIEDMQWDWTYSVREWDGSQWHNP